MESALDHIRPWVDAAAAAGFYGLDLQPGYTDFAPFDNPRGKAPAGYPLSPAVQRDRTSQDVLVELYEDRD